MTNTLQLAHLYLSLFRIQFTIVIYCYSLLLRYDSSFETDTEQCRSYNLTPSKTSMDLKLLQWLSVKLKIYKIACLCHRCNSSTAGRCTETSMLKLPGSLMCQPWSAPESSQKNGRSHKNGRNIVICSQALYQGEEVFLLIRVAYPTSHLLLRMKNIETYSRPNYPAYTKIHSYFVSLMCSACLQDFHRKCSGLTRT